MGHFDMKNLFLLSILISLNVFASSLDSLEAITDEAKTLNNFLYEKNSQGILYREKYYEELNTYLNFKIDKEEFEEIIFQLQEMSKKSPRFEQRIFEKVGKKKVVFSKKLESSSQFELQFENRSKWIRTYSAFSEEILEERGMDKIESQQRIVQIATEKLKDLNFIIQNKQSIFFKNLNEKRISKKERKFQIANFYKMLSISSEVIEASDYYLYLNIVSEEWRDLLQNNYSANTIFKHIEEIINRKKHLINLEGLKLHPSIRDNMLKYFKDYLKQVGFRDDIYTFFPQDIFRKEILGDSLKKDMKIELSSLPRRIHGIFKGFKGGECVRNCMRRWGTNLLEEAIFFEVTLDDKYSGFIQVIPVKAKGNEETIYGSLEIGSEIFNKMVKTPNSSSKVTIFEYLFPEIRSLFPSDWILARGGNYSIANYGTLKTIDESTFYKNGDEILYNRFVHVSPLAEEISDFDSYYEFLKLIKKMNPDREYSKNEFIENYNKNIFQLIKELDKFEASLLKNLEEVNSPESFNKFIKEAKTKGNELEIIYLNFFKKFDEDNLLYIQEFLKTLLPEEFDFDYDRSLVFPFLNEDIEEIQYQMREAFYDSDFNKLNEILIENDAEKFERFFNNLYFNSDDFEIEEKSLTYEGYKKMKLEKFTLYFKKGEKKFSDVINSTRALIIENGFNIRSDLVKYLNKDIVSFQTERVPLKIYGDTMIHELSNGQELQPRSLNCLQEIRSFFP